MAPLVTTLLGHFCEQICSQELQTLAQSGHTACGLAFANTLFNPLPFVAQRSFKE